MRVLLDACVPRPLRNFLSAHTVKTAQEMGWGNLKNGDLLKAAISGVRDARIKAGIKNRDGITLQIKTGEQETYRTIAPMLAKQVNAKEVLFTDGAVAKAFTTVIGKDQFYIVSDAPVDTSGQKAELLKEIEYLKGFLVSVEKKLGNEKFVANAKPEVVASEQKKKAEASKALFQKELAKNGMDAITTEILDAPKFYYAEDYHQQYLAKNPGGYCGLGGTGVSCPIGLKVEAAE